MAEAVAHLFGRVAPLLNSALTSENVLGRAIIQQRMTDAKLKGMPASQIAPRCSLNFAEKVESFMVDGFHLRVWIAAKASDPRVLLATESVNEECISCRIDVPVVQSELLHAIRNFCRVWEGRGCRGMHCFVHPLF